MKHLSIPSAIYERSFALYDCRYQVIITRELNPITCKPTGIYIGSFISSWRGTGNFKLDKNKSLIRSSLDILNPGITMALYGIIHELEINPDAVPQSSTIPGKHSFFLKEFDYLGNDYKIAATAELYPEEEGLDFTGNYLVTLISGCEGTKQFELVPDPHLRWVLGENTRGMDPGLIDIIAGVIAENRR